eukprot:CAMPEP_0172483310 /NCGR_PEP_ID=MMETSP1066-20121228/10267_1 /TAXON_ID=671091 /ORGANISM="Coscinodiscus wailesii, Strain CCMP2513" /LENGTH=99 /DNA_ID=CAMNT_0013247111 /DNA_START=46 /DNA_END=345 /DNA_ORIENTATION=-
MAVATQIQPAPVASSVSPTLDAKQVIAFDAKAVVLRGCKALSTIAFFVIDAKTSSRHSSLTTTFSSASPTSASSHTFLPWSIGSLSKSLVPWNSSGAGK